MTNIYCEHTWEVLVKTTQYISFICLKCGKTNIISKNYINDNCMNSNNTYNEEYLQLMLDEIQLDLMEIEKICEMYDNFDEFDKDNN